MGWDQPHSPGVPPERCHPRRHQLGCLLPEFLNCPGEIDAHAAQSDGSGKGPHQCRSFGANNWQCVKLHAIH